jgi:hypothetical protein
VKNSTASKTCPLKVNFKTELLQLQRAARDAAEYGVTDHPYGKIHRYIDKDKTRDIIGV